MTVCDNAGGSPAEHSRGCRRFLYNTIIVSVGLGGSDEGRMLTEKSVSVLSSVFALKSDSSA